MFKKCKANKNTKHSNNNNGYSYWAAVIILH